MSLILDLILVVLLCGLVNSLLGVFLILRETALVSFGLAHSILVGIVIAYLITNDLTSPFLMIGAALSGVLIVILVEKINQSQFIKYDAALGLTYLSIFALGIILLSRYAQNTTLTLNGVVAGQILFTPFLRMQILGLDFPSIVWIFAGLLLINILFVFLFYKELVITSFDAGYAKLLGIDPIWMNYLLMGLVSLTIVGSYSAVGAILVVAFMITPGATAVLYSSNIRNIIFLTLLISILNGSLGLWMAISWNLSLSGTIATVHGIVFLIGMFFSPNGVLRQFLVTRKRLSPPPNYLVEHGGK